MVNLIVFLKAKGYPFKVLLKRTRGLVLDEKFLFRIFAFGIFRIISKLWTSERVYRQMGAEKDNVSLNTQQLFTMPRYFTYKGPIVSLDQTI
jgi:hypothetical protein